MLKIEHVDVLFLESDTPRQKKDREHIAGLNLCKEMISKYFGEENPEFSVNDFDIKTNGCVGNCTSNATLGVRNVEKYSVLINKGLAEIIN